MTTTVLRYVSPPPNSNSSPGRRVVYPGPSDILEAPPPEVSDVALGHRFHFLVRPDLRLDDDSDFIQDEFQPSPEELASQGVKAIDFALRPNNLKPERICKCRETQWQKVDYNIVLEHNGLKPMEIYKPQVTVVGALFTPFTSPKSLPKDLVPTQRAPPAQSGSPPVDYVAEVLREAGLSTADGPLPLEKVMEAFGRAYNERAGPTERPQVPRPARAPPIGATLFTPFPSPPPGQSAQASSAGAILFTPFPSPPPQPAQAPPTSALLFTPFPSPPAASDQASSLKHKESGAALRVATPEPELHPQTAIDTVEKDTTEPKKRTRKAQVIVEATRVTRSQTSKEKAAAQPVAARLRNRLDTSSKTAPPKTSGTSAAAASAALTQPRGTKRKRIVDDDALHPSKKARTSKRQPVSDAGSKGMSAAPRKRTRR